MFRFHIMIAGAIVSIFAAVIHAQNCHSGTVPTTKTDTVKQEKEITIKKTQTICPVMGNKIDRSFSTVWKDEKDGAFKRIYFCCEPCIDIFKSNPAKYLKKLEKMKQPIEIDSTI